MNEETMEAMLEESWGDEAPGEVRQEESRIDRDPGETRREENKGDEGAAGADNEAKAAGAPNQPPAPKPPERISIPRGAPGKPHPLLTRAKENARRQDMQRFMQAYPGVAPDSIPREVWVQVAGGVPLVSAYTMHENAQLRARLAAEQQHRANRSRTTGRLGGSSGFELDELDRMWNEED